MAKRGTVDTVDDKARDLNVVRDCAGEPGTAQLRIGRDSNSDRCSVVVEDGASGCQIVELEMDAATLLRAITCMQVTVKASWRAVDRIGKMRQVVTRIVPIPSKYADSNRSRMKDADYRGILRPHETDGWVGSSGDLFNYHRAVRSADGKAEAYYVSFVRWVDRPDAPR